MTVHFNAFRGATHPKNLNSLIIYSPQCWWKVRKVIFLEFHILNNWVSWCTTQKNKHKMTPYSSSGVIQVQNCFVHCSFHLTKTVKIMKLVYIREHPLLLVNIEMSWLIYSDSIPQHVFSSWKILKNIKCSFFIALECSIT